MIRLRLFSILILTFFIFSCDKKKNEEETSFSKVDLQKNIGKNIILPGYKMLIDKVDSLEQSHTSFVALPSQELFEQVQLKWYDAYLQWNRVSMFEFGPALDMGLKGALGLFPNDTTKVIDNINSASYDLTTVSNTDAVGLHVFDFLLYRKGAFDNYKNDVNYQNYIQALIDKVQSELNYVYNKWNSTYLDEFSNSTSTASTSAFSMFVNEFVKSYEETKWTKVGIPSGKQTLGIVQKNYIETRMSKNSLPVLSENLKAIKKCFNGESLDGVNGIGFDDYLIDLDRSALVNTINNTLDDIINNMNQISNDFETEVDTNPSSIEAIYTKIHNLTVSLKTDMTSAFGVLITYQDNDGD